MVVRHSLEPEQRDALRLGSYPTPLWKLEGLDSAAHDLWIKDDGQTAGLYGGNKVRKLERLLWQARRAGAARLLTVGAAGSHHVLATCLYGAQIGLRTHAVLTPQPRTEHAVATLRAGLAAGLSAVPARSGLDALRALRRERRPGDFAIGPGGWGRHGTWAYCLAVDELRAQLAEQGVPRLDAIIVAAGSGSTAGGLLAGVLRTRIAERVVAVQVSDNPALRPLILGQALHALWHHADRPRPLAALRALSIERRFVGGGYGCSSEPCEHATLLARSFGLGLEPTYTAKAFAAALARAGVTESDNPPASRRLSQRRTYLYWHTLSAVPIARLLAGAADALPVELDALLIEPPSTLPRRR